jgi:hypothetical protein
MVTSYFYWNREYEIGLLRIAARKKGTKMCREFSKEKGNNSWGYQQESGEELLKYQQKGKKRDKTRKEERERGGREDSKITHTNSNLIHAITLTVL